MFHREMDRQVSFESGFLTSPSNCWKKHTNRFSLKGPFNPVVQITPLK
jgi:hypothetical protein